MYHTEYNSGLEIIFAVTKMNYEGWLECDDVVGKAIRKEIRLANHRISLCKAGLSSNGTSPSIIRAPQRPHKVLCFSSSYAVSKIR